MRGKIGVFHQVKETARMKLRHEPFSVYLKFELPESKVGTEAVYPVDEGQMIAHSTEFPASLLGSITMKTDDWRAMIDNRYPITTIGMKNLLEKIQSMAAKHDAQLRQCDIDLLEDEQIDGRPCLCVDISNPEPQEDFLLYRLRIFLDKQWNVPVCVEAWDYPHDGQEKPFLVERYVYRNIKFNQNLTDEDFDPKNDAYQFK